MTIQLKKRKREIAFTNYESQNSTIDMFLGEIFCTEQEHKSLRHKVN